MLSVFSVKVMLNLAFDSISDVMRGMNRITGFSISTLLYEVSTPFEPTAGDIKYSHVECRIGSSNEIAGDNEVLFGITFVQLALVVEKILKFGLYHCREGFVCYKDSFIWMKDEGLEKRMARLAAGRSPKIQNVKYHFAG